MNKAKKVLFAGFLACTMLLTAACVPTTSSPEAWELENATVVYIVDKNGVETANYTVVGKNGEEYTKSVATGRTVVEIDQYSVRINGELVEDVAIETTVGNEPKIEVLATFDDGAAGWVTISDDMYVSAKPDYTKAGVYAANFKLIERLSIPVLVKGDEPVVLQTLLLNENMGGMCVLWNKADVVAATYDVSTVFWGYYTYSNGEESQAVVNAKADQIKPIDWTAESEEGIYNFSVTNENGDSGVLQAYVMDADSETEVTVMDRQLDSFNMMESLTALKGSTVEDIDTSGMIAMEMFTIGMEAMGMRVAEIPEAAVYTLDTSVCGEQALTATWTVGEETVTATTSVLVYETIEETAEVTYAYVNSYKAVESGVIDMTFEINSRSEYVGDDQVLDTKYNYETVALTADMIKGTAPDFTTAGVKVFTIEVGGNEYTYAVEVWVEAEQAVATTTNVASLALPEEITLVKDSVNIELYVRQNFVGVETEIAYIEPVNGSTNDYVVLKASAFDWSAVKMNTVGAYALKVSYEGYEQTITVNVVDEIIEEELVFVAQLEIGWDFYVMGMQNGLVGITLYENGVAELMDGFSPFYYESVWATYTLDDATGTFELAIDGEKFAIATVVDSDEDGAYDMVGAYVFEGEPTEVMLEMATPYGGTMFVTVSMYDNGYAVIMGDWNPESTGNAYTLKDGVLTIGSASWVVVGTGEDVQYLTIMSGAY